jgi:AraC-like DNA-binding protein
MPTDILEVVTNQIETLYAHGSTPHIDTVADSLAMSKRTLQREIAGRGTSYAEIIHHSRMRRACEELDNPDKTVTEIAFELGYADASNFTRAFRRETGVSPSAFRRQAASA